MLTYLIRLIQIVALFAAPFGVSSTTWAATTEMSDMADPCPAGMADSGNLPIKLDACLVLCSTAVLPMPLLIDQVPVPQIDPTCVPVNAMCSASAKVPIPPPRSNPCL